jgi:hypothetical protein
MLFQDRPLLPSLDSGVYLARPRLEDGLLRPLRQGRNVLLLGDAGSGKTTLMLQVGARLETEGLRTAWVNASLASTVPELLGLVAAVLGVQRPVEIESEEASESVRLLTLTRALSSRPPTVVMVDGIVDPEVAFGFFGRLRDELWATGHTWFVSARPKDASLLRSPPADAFWASVTEIPPLNDEEVRALLRLGLDEDERRNLRQVPLSGFHPRLLIREVHHALQPEQDGGEPAYNDLLERARGLGRSEEVALFSLIDLGRPASAHDSELHERLGWSRPYTQRIFSHLEAEGLVRSLPEPAGERVGRPRKLYEPNARAAA